MAYVKNLSDARKPVAPKLDFAYMPSFNRLKVSTDVGILGIDPKLEKQSHYLSASFGKQGGELTAQENNAFPCGRDGGPDVCVPATAGRQLRHPHGNPGCRTARRWSRRRSRFEQKVFPFQGFQGGLEETVVKPYTPIKTAGRAFETVGNQVQLTDAGFVAGIRSKLVPAAAAKTSWLRR